MGDRFYVRLARDQLARIGVANGAQWWMRWVAVGALAMMVACELIAWRLRHWKGG